MRNIFSVLFFILITTAAWAQNENLKDAQSSPFAQSKFVPDISLIADFAAVGRNMKDEEHESLEIPGFTHSHSGEEHGHSHSGMNSKRGFNLNYAELAISSVVDPYFDLSAIFHLSESSFEIEETYFNTRFLPFGFKLKAGKFLSNFGRINEQHAHYWDFTDSALVNKVFFGEHGLLEKGLRLTWVLPVPVYCMFGGEIFQGDNEASFGTEGFEDATGTNKIKDSAYPNLHVGFIKSSVDIGELTILMGVSYATGKTRINHDVDDAANPEGHAVFADTRILGADLTFKYSVDSYRYISLQSEYLYRLMDGNRYGSDGTKADISKKQSGLYSQLVARFAQRWRLGVRYDLLQKNKVKIGGSSADIPENLARYSGMIDFTPTEFSRIRLQYKNDRSGYVNEGAERKINHEMILQFNMAIGAHGAHSF